MELYMIKFGCTASGFLHTTADISGASLLQRDPPLVGDLGPLGIVFNTPSHHRVHHGRNPYCIDKNYGGVFIIWDKSHVLWDMLIFKGQMKDEKGEPVFPGITNKIKAALHPPGWFPGVPVQPFFHWMSLVDTAHGVPEIISKSDSLKIAALPSIPPSSDVIHSAL
ncbi:hypothetical protein TELCIR_03543 [Teladorsagia circumcincta]|uniref:Fatty acid hydroxylase domain-containing protein n=1 Tax=Teladorsagia circumcincta TaxID=45464 RepID=A0A2G9UW62_TELCI|nr:hypothetical protein TELCIR_03543 [Teladorsagia circumcincta]